MNLVSGSAQSFVPGGPSAHNEGPFLASFDPARGVRREASLVLRRPRAQTSWAGEKGTGLAPGLSREQGAKWMLRASEAQAHAARGWVWSKERGHKSNAAQAVQALPCRPFDQG